jgi:lipopolysaccharide export system protein LptA
VKKICLIILSGLIGGLLLRAQTGTNATPQTERGPTRIYSDSADFYMAGHKAVYHGNVRVEDPQMRLVCAQLTANLPPSGGRPNRIVAETNVVIDFTDEKGQTNHTTSDKAVYAYEVQNGATNETVTLTGHAELENAQFSLSGEPIYVDLLNKSIHADNQKMVLHESLNGATTNMAPAGAGRGTNNPPAPKLF